MMYEQIVKRQEMLIAVRDAAKTKKPKKSSAVEMKSKIVPIKSRSEKWSSVSERDQMENEIVTNKRAQVKKIEGTMTLGIHGCPVAVTERLGVLAARMSVSKGRKVSKAEAAIEILQKALFSEGQ